MTNTPTHQYLFDIVDMQGDFVRGTLPVAGATGIIPLFNAFLKALQPSFTKAVLFKYDSHFAGEYPLSDEKTQFGFPDHCFYGTDGQKLVLDADVIDSKITVGHMNKNEFAMWQYNKLDKSRVTFTDKVEEQVYDNLFKVTPRFNDIAPGVPRDEWLASLGKPEDVPVVMGGVASDFCVKQAMKGYLDRGHKLIVLTDLVAGIGGDISEVKSGNIRDVASQLFASQLKSRQLELMTTTEFLTKVAANQPAFKLTA